MTTKYRIQMIQDLLQLLPFSELQVQQIFQEIKGYKEGKYKFEGVRKGISYITVAVDPLKEYTTVSQDIKV